MMKTKPKFTKEHTCLICGQVLKKAGAHLRHKHGLSGQEYYDKYILKNESEKQCKVCGKETKFADIYFGYRDYCSKKCMNSKEGQALIASDRSNTLVEKEGGLKDRVTKRLDEMGAELISYERRQTEKTTFPYVTFRCKNGHVDEKQATYIDNGAGCSYCEGTRLDEEAVRKKANDRGFNFTAPNGWNGKNTNFHVECLKCGHKFETRYTFIIGKGFNSNHIKSKCPKCANLESWSEAKDMLEAEGYKFLTPLDEWEGKKWVDYECPKGHVGRIRFHWWKNYNQRCGQCFEGGTSRKEKELLDELVAIYPGKIVENDRTLLGYNREIDAFVPGESVGIEFNGTYWHSVQHNKNNQTAHMRKSKTAVKKGIDLLHVHENEWDDPEKRKLVLSEMRDRLHPKVSDGEMSVSRGSVAEAMDWISARSRFSDYARGCATGSVIVRDKHEIVCCLLLANNGDCDVVHAGASAVDWKQIVDTLSCELKRPKIYAQADDGFGLVSMARVMKLTATEWEKPEVTFWDKKAKLKVYDAGSCIFS